MNAENVPKQDEVVQRVRHLIQRLARDGCVVADLDGKKHPVFPVGISIVEGEALRKWVRSEKAVHTIEVGLGYGISALHICEGLLLNGDAAARHVVLDPNQVPRFSNCGLQMLKEAGIDHLVEHHTEESQQILPRFWQEERRFDLGFIDGNHRFDRVFLDLFYLGRLVRPGGIIVLDDYDWPGIAKAVSFYVNNLDWQIEETNDDGQQIVLRTAAEQDSRSGRYFVEF
jgi:predicted O-methyltransferase YrrM